MNCIKLFDFPDGDLLVQRINHWHSSVGDLWCIDTTIQLTPVLHRHVRERYATEQERDEIFRAINHWVAFPRFCDMRLALLKPLPNCMDTLPLDHNPVPGTGSRNITLLLAEWLRKMGFTVVEQGGLVPTALVATWLSIRNYRYELQYVFGPTGGVLRLVHSVGFQYIEVLIDGATVHRIREARYLLLSSVCYDFDRKAALAAGKLKPTYAPHTD